MHVTVLPRVAAVAVAVQEVHIEHLVPSAAGPVAVAGVLRRRRAARDAHRRRDAAVAEGALAEVVRHVRQEDPRRRAVDSTAEHRAATAGAWGRHANRHAVHRIVRCVDRDNVAEGERRGEARVTEVHRCVKRKLREGAC